MEPPMSMYTQLLDAAFEQRGPMLVRPTEDGALDTVRRCRGELARDTPTATDLDAVPVVLAREISYDLALLELAAVLGVTTDPSRFEPPRDERARLEQLFSDLGIMLQPLPATEDATSGRN
jgi:hypothetical protein